MSSPQDEPQADGRSDPGRPAGAAGDPLETALRAHDHRGPAVLGSAMSKIRSRVSALRVENDGLRAQVAHLHRLADSGSGDAKQAAPASRPARSSWPYRLILRTRHKERSDQIAIDERRTLHGLVGDRRAGGEPPPRSKP